MNRALASLGPLLGRVLLAAIFAWSGWQKVSSPGRAASAIAGHGLPFATVAAYAAGAFELAAAVLIVVGAKARLAAVATVLYLVLVTYLFHWNPAMRGDGAQLLNLLKNAGIAGGMLLLASHGPGPVSIDGG